MSDISPELVDMEFRSNSAQKSLFEYSQLFFLSRQRVVMAVGLTYWPLGFRFLSSNPGSDSPFLIEKDRYEREKLYTVKRFIDNPQNSPNRPPAKMRTHANKTERREKLAKLKKRR